MFLDCGTQSMREVTAHIQCEKVCCKHVQVREVVREVAICIEYGKVGEWCGNGGDGCGGSITSRSHFTATLLVSDGYSRGAGGGGGFS